MRGNQEALQVRLMNWYIDTSGVAPTKRDPRGAAVLDRPATLEHVAPIATLLDH
jgi:hypothetical protein